MNLMQFYDKISSDSENKSARNAKFFSEEVTVYNILNGTFKDEDIKKIKMSPSISSPVFDITLATQNIASCAENNLDNQIVLGAYKPLYKVNATATDFTLTIKLDEVRE